MKDSVRSHRLARGILGSILLGAVFALGIINVEDPDAWTHLALGRDIVAHRGFPVTEQFNFPSLELPYYNPEWLFGLVFYLAYLAAGIPGVILLKASIVTLAFSILLRHSLIPRDQPSHGALGMVTAAALLFLILLMVRHRFVERPDILLMVFLGFMIYALDAYVYEGKRYLYLLPALQVLWVNTHPSVIVGLVPFVAFLVGGQLQRLFRERRGIGLPGTPSAGQLRTIAAVFAATVLASFLNPYGIAPFLLPFRLAESQWFRHEILELQAPSLSDVHGMPMIISALLVPIAPFIITALLVLTFIVSIKRLSLISVLLVAPFVYLGFSARRFVFLLAIVSAPVLARHLRSLVGRVSAGWAQRMSLPAGLVTMSLVVAVTGLFLTRVGPFADPRKIPGFGINFDIVPEGALRYLDRVGVAGRLYNTFEWGGYVIWRYYPRRMPIIDGRGYVPPGLLDEIQMATTSPAYLDRLQRQYGFDVAVAEYPYGTEVFEGEMPDADLALTSPDWALVYWDDLALVYLRRTEALAAVIERDEYRHVKPANGIQYLRRKLLDRNLLAPIQAELRRNIGETQSSTGYTLLGVLYNDVGNHEKAIETLSRVRDLPFRSYIQSAHLGLAFAHERLGDVKQAIQFYEKAAQQNEDPKILYSIGAAFERIGNDREAVHYFEWARARDARLALVYPALIRAYRRTGRTDRLQELEAAYRGILAAARGDDHFRTGVRLYMEGKLFEAKVAFEESLKGNPRDAVALSNLGYIYFDLGQVDKAFAEQKRALEVDASYANAHYGLALIYRKRGDYVLARKHFEEYLRLEPRGYWARKAQEAIGRLPPS